MEKSNPVKKTLNEAEADLAKDLARRLIRKKKLTKIITKLDNRYRGKSKPADVLEYYKTIQNNKRINNALIVERREQLNMKQSVKEETKVKTAPDEQQPIKPNGSEAKELLSYALKSFKKKFGANAMYTNNEFAISMSTLKNMLKLYDANQIKEFIEEYYNLDDAFLQSAGYKLRFLPSKINTIIATRSKFKTKHQDFTKKDYGKSLSNSQLHEYIAMKKSGECTGKEPWAKEYEKEIHDRELDG